MLWVVIKASFVRLILKCVNQLHFRIITPNQVTTLVVVITAPVGKRRMFLWCSKSLQLVLSPRLLCDASTQGIINSTDVAGQILGGQSFLHQNALVWILLAHVLCLFYFMLSMESLFIFNILMGVYVIAEGLNTPHAKIPLDVFVKMIKMDSIRDTLFSLNYFLLL